MENIDNSRSLFDIQLTDEVKSTLSGAARTAGIMAFLMLANTILGLASYFTNLGRTQSRLESDTAAQLQGGDNLPSLIINLILTGFLFYFLNRFAKSTPLGIQGNNSQLTTEGLGGLETYLKIMGVLIILALIFIGLAVLVLL